MQDSIGPEWRPGYLLVYNFTLPTTHLTETIDPIENC